MTDAERIQSLNATNAALTSEVAVLRAQLEEAVAGLRQANADLAAAKAAAQTAHDRAIEMMAKVGQTAPVPPDPKQTAQPKKSLTQMARERIGFRS